MSQKKKSFYKILKLMQEFDDQTLDISEEEFKEIVEELPTKIDDCKYFINSLESRIAVIHREISDLGEIKTAMMNTLKSFKRYLSNTMINMEVDKLPGEKHVLSLARRSTVKFKDIEIDSDIYLSLNMLSPYTVKRTYSINADGFKKLCENNQEIKEKYATEIVSTFPQFRLNRSTK